MKLVDRHDFTATLRSLRKSPGFVAIATISLGLAIGVATTTFAIVDAIKHPHVAYDDPDQLRGVWMWTVGVDRRSRAHEMYMALRARTDLYESMAVFRSGSWQGDMVLVRGAVVATRVATVSTNYFTFLGLHPLYGRTFHRTALGAPPDEGVVVSYRFWQTQMSRAMPLAKASVTFNDQTYTVIGVLPPGVADWAGGDVSLPMSRAVEEGRNADTEDASNRETPQAVIRLRPGADTVWIANQLTLLTRTFTQRYGLGFRIRLRSARDFARPLLAFHKALGLTALIVLVLACANVANLLVARVVGRQRELAVRMAVGASQADIGRFVVSEAVVLAALGGTAGTVFSLWGIHLAKFRLTTEIERVGALVPQMSWRMFAFALAATMVTVFLIAVAAVLRARSTNVSSAMKDGSGNVTVRSGGVHRWFVAVEVGLSLIVIMGAALLTRATSIVRSYDFGYTLDGLVRVGVPEPTSFGSMDQSARTGTKRDSIRKTNRDSIQRLLHGVVSGVQQVAGVRAGSMYSYGSVPGFVVTSDFGGADPLRQGLWGIYSVAPDFLTVLGLPIVEGRNFLPGDVDSIGVAIVDDTIAKRLWPGESPIGHQIKLGRIESNAPWVRVVGVTRSSRLGFLMFDPDLMTEPLVYVARASASARSTLVVRIDPRNAATPLALYRYLRTAMPGAPPHLEPWLQEFESEVAERTFLAIIFMVMGAFALGLTTVGLYGVLSYSGAQRTREFAMRIALGARGADLFRLMLHDGAVLVLAGTGFGAIVAVWSAQILKQWLFGIAPFDALALVVAECTLMSVTLLAAIAPAVRAGRADPVELLRAT